MAELTLSPPDLETLDAVRLAPGAEAADRALEGRLLAAVTALGATGAEDEVVMVATLASAGVPLVAVAGLGPAPDGPRTTIGTPPPHR